MRAFLKTSGRWLKAGWYLPLALLALPDCAFQTGGVPPKDAFDPGTGDLSSAIMCDIPKPPSEGTGQCASSTDVGIGMPLGHAAVALADGTKTSLGLDFSPAALQACNGFPRKVEFFGAYPDGTTVCLNCGQLIPSKFPTPTAVCVAECRELVAQLDVTPAEGVDAYCQANAKVSTNFAPNICFGKACSMGGTPDPNFVDPRRTAEPVKWSGLSELIGSQDSGNTLTRTAPTTGGTQADFNAGGASEQLINGGDAWVEFGGPDPTLKLSQVLGVRASCADTTTCPDTDPSLADIGFSIILNSDGFVYVIESSPTVKVIGPFGQYAANERYRIHVVDNNDGTATISYTRIVGICNPGSVCNESQLYQHVGTGPSYPLRIDASFREQNATVSNVTVMRIQ